MYISRHKKRLILMTVAIVLTVALLAVVVTSLIISADAARREREKVERAAPLEHEKTTLQQQLYRLEGNLIDTLPCASTMTVTVLRLDSALYDTIFPIFSGTSEYVSGNFPIALTGTICLSADELPGGEGNITFDEYCEMIDSGWTSALFISASDASNIEGYIQRMSSLLHDMGIDMPDTACFANGAYSTSYDNTLSELGIEYVIHSGEEGLPLISADSDAPVWRAGALGWNTIGKSAVLMGDLIVNIGNAVFTIDFNPRATDTYFPADAMSSASLGRMTDKLRQYVDGGALIVGPLSAGEEAYLLHKQAYELSRPAIELKRAELEAKIADIDRRLYAIYSGKE